MTAILTKNSNFIKRWKPEAFSKAKKIITTETPPKNSINSKAEHLDLWNRGLLGNKMRSWKSYADILASDYRGEFSMRTKQQSGGNSGGLATYRLKFSDLERTMNEWISKGTAIESIYFNESAPDEELVTQGEIMVTTDHYDYLYCNEPLKMREAMSKAKVMRGIAVVSYLKEVMMPNSWDDINELFEIYPDSVIEFSVYQRTLGIYPNRNSIFWEVRNY